MCCVYVRHLSHKLLDQLKTFLHLLLTWLLLLRLLLLLLLCIFFSLGRRNRRKCSWNSSPSGNSSSPPISVYSEADSTDTKIQPERWSVFTWQEGLVEVKHSLYFNTCRKIAGQFKVGKLRKTMPFFCLLRRKERGG